jgi:hypothetical protein
MIVRGQEFTLLSIVWWDEHFEAESKAIPTVSSERSSGFAKTFLLGSIAVIEIQNQK